MSLVLSCLVAAVQAVPVRAGDMPVVVELFTSQGCSSCPPADALLRDLTTRDDVLPLALHVDYWDYIGWKDHFARPEFTARQKHYAAFAGRKMIYTPQMVVAGREDVVGVDAAKLAEAITAHRARSPVMTMRVTRSGTALTVQVKPVATADTGGPVLVQLVRFAPLRKVEISSGENAGKTIAYANVVEDLSVLGDWDGAAPAEFTARLDGDSASAVLIQRPGPGAILAAARVR
ncbi:DUF1223 domain-containing protein [Pukyongiella litopenaei]|nr:DUF1223 domain-containing protein [Pukyongiella litopenaei]